MYFEKEQKVRDIFLWFVKLLGKWPHSMNKAERYMLGVGVDDKSEDNGQFSTSSYSGPRSQRAELLRKPALIIKEEASLIEWKLVKLADVSFKLLRFNRNSVEVDKPRFESVSVVLCGDYLQPLRVVMSRKWVGTDDGEGRYVPANLLTEFTWETLLWEHAKLCKTSQQVPQNKYTRFSECHLSVSTGSFPNR